MLDKAICMGFRSRSTKSGTWFGEPGFLTALLPAPIALAEETRVNLTLVLTESLLVA